MPNQYWTKEERDHFLTDCVGPTLGIGPARRILATVDALEKEVEELHRMLQTDTVCDCGEIPCHAAALLAALDGK